AAASGRQQLRVRRRVPDEKRQTRGLRVRTQPVLARVIRIGLGRFHPEKKLRRHQQARQRELEARIEVTRLLSPESRSLEPGNELALTEWTPEKHFAVTLDELAGARFIRLLRVRRLAGDDFRPLALAQRLIGDRAAEHEVLFEARGRQ